jgi:hypothetical protein
MNLIEFQLSNSLWFHILVSGSAFGYGIRLLYLSLRNCPGFLQTLPAYPGFKIAEAIQRTIV